MTYTLFLDNTEQVTVGEMDDSTHNLICNSVPVDEQVLKLASHSFLRGLHKKYPKYRFIVGTYHYLQNIKQDFYHIKRIILKNKVYYYYIYVDYNNRHAITFAHNIHTICHSKYFEEYIVSFCLHKSINCLRFYIINEENRTDVATVSISIYEL